MAGTQGMSLKVPCARCEGALSLARFLDGYLCCKRCSGEVEHRKPKSESVPVGTGA